MSQLPCSWVNCRLEDVAEWGSGGTPARSNPAYFNGDIPWIKTGELGKMFLRDADECISIEAIKNSSAKIFPKGSVAIAMYGATIGKTSILAIDAATNQACAVGQPLYGVLLSEFLYYYLTSQLRGFVDAGKGGAQPNISQGVIKSWPFPLAPINEQGRIVAKIEALFSELDKGIECLTTAREQLRVYRQSVLKAAFEGKVTARWRDENTDKLEGSAQHLARIEKERETLYEQEIADWKAAVSKWEAKGSKGGRPRKPIKHKPWSPLTNEDIDLLPNIPNAWRFVRLTDIAQVGSGMSVSATRKLNDPIKVAYLRVANVQRGYLDLSEIKYMHIERAQLKGLALNKWDVLFNEGGDRDKLGRGWIWQCEVEPCITQNHVFRASLYIASQTASKVLSHWGNTFGQRYFEKTGKQTTNLASINKGVLSAFPVPLISLAEQIELLDQIDRIMTVLDAQESEIAAALQGADVLRQSILKKAFSGQLVAQDVDDEPASMLLERIGQQRPRR